ncbi:MAG: NHL repeat-containing protein [Spirochaetia bacterium]|nr:NHL repeat-containing protein [Spirochaetia bacterium]
MFKRIVFLVLALIPAVILFAEDMPKEDERTVITDRNTTLVYPSFWHTPFGIHRGTQMHLKLFLGNRTFFSNPQDLACTKLLLDYGKINKDRDDWQLTVYGVNSGQGEIIYNPSMHTLSRFGSIGSGDGQLMTPKGIACNEQGDVYVVDTGNDRIARFYNNGKRVKFIRNIGETGSEPGKFNRPSYIALDSAGRIYVTDTGNNRIQVFSKSGGYLCSIGQEKGIVNPQGICVSDKGERYSGYKEDYIFLIDGVNNRLQKIGFDGTPVASIRVNEVLGKNIFLTTLEQDYYGNLYIVDNLNSQVYKFSPDLKFIDSFGKYGDGDYQFETPTGIAIYKHYGQIFVSDKNSAQYFWIGSDARAAETLHLKNNGKDALEFNFFLTEKSFVTINVVDAYSNTVEVCRQVGLECGKNSIDWEIPDIYRSVLRNGSTYDVLLRIMATYSSYPHIEKVVKMKVFIE